MLARARKNPERSQQRPQAAKVGSDALVRPERYPAAVTSNVSQPTLTPLFPDMRGLPHHIDPMAAAVRVVFQMARHALAAEFQDLLGRQFMGGQHIARIRIVPPITPSAWRGGLARNDRNREAA